MTYDGLRCRECGERVRHRQSGVLHEVTGWVAPRSGGGIHHIVNPTPTGRYIHKACLEEHQGDQGALFGEA
jgi:hypothetical protein